MNTVIIGGGKGCRAVLEMLVTGRLAVFRPEILAVVDPNENAPGMALARRMGWRTLTSLDEALALPGLELIIELVGSDHFLEELYRIIPPGIGILDHRVARIFWDLENLTGQLRLELERKSSLEEQLRRERNQLQQILDSLPDAVLVIDGRKKLEYVNARFEEITGQDRASLVRDGEFIDPFCEPQEGRLGPGHICSLEEVLKTRSPVQFIHFQPGEHSDQQYFRVIVNPIFNDEGEIDRIVETARLITAQVTQARETEESERRFRQFVDNAHDMITMKDREGRYQVINEQAAALFSMSPMDCIGRTDRDILSGRIAEILIRKDQETIAKKEHSSYEDTLLVDGERRYFDTVRFPLVDYKGDVTGVCSISRDVTEQKRLQQAVIQSEKMAAVGKLAASVAHEINNPLTGVLTFAEELKMDFLDKGVEERVIEDLDVIISETMRCRQIVASLLDYSRVERPQRQKIGLRAIIERSLSLIKKQAAFQDVEFDLRLAEDLPEVRVDPNQMQQVFLNLIINAAEAMSNSGRITLCTQLNRDRQQIEASVSDQGPGIAPEIAKTVFEPFCSTKGQQGSGLGLSVVQTIINQHGGSIRVDSQAGGGATFTVSLPATGTGG